MAAELCCNILKNPFEIMKQHLQAGNEPNLRAAFNYIRLNYGYRGFYLGLGSLLLREIPFSCIQMPIYEAIRIHFIDSKRQFMTLYEAGISGFIAGSFAGLLTNPIDVVKTNIMTQKNLIYTGVVDCNQKLYKQHGVRVFSKGMNFRCLVTGGVSAFFFAGYEIFMEVFNDRF